MPLYLGPHQLAECMRSGIKCYASELVRDGRNPNLLVLPRYADDASPQEQPYRPDDAEGRARFPIAPDHGFDVNPVLTAPSGNTVRSALLVAAAGDFEGLPSIGWIDALIGAGQEYGSLTPEFFTGLHIVGLFYTPAGGYIVFADSQEPNAPPAEESLPALTFTDNTGDLITLSSVSADDSIIFTPNGGPQSSIRGWAFGVSAASRITAGVTYVINRETENSGRPTVTWTQAKTIGPRVESYKVYRATGTAGTFSLLTTLPVEFEGPSDYDWIHPLTYTDDTAELDTQYRYRVDAITDDARTLPSNVVTVTLEGSFRRLLEDGSLRLLEDDDVRLLEEAP